jgi:hypothetical protein
MRDYKPPDCMVRVPQIIDIWPELVKDLPFSSYNMIMPQYLLAIVTYAVLESKW